MLTLKKSLTLIALAVSCQAAMPAYAVRFSEGESMTMPALSARFASASRVSAANRAVVVNTINRDLTVNVVKPVSDNQGEAEFALTPAISNGPVSSFLDLDGPDGELWYYTSDLFINTVQHPYYKEQVLQAYRFDIYDSSFNHVGTIYDKMEYADDELRVPGPAAGISLLPVVTKNFFNSTDDLEVVVGITVNTTTYGLNHTYSRVYSIGGDKVEKTIFDNEHPEGYQMMCDVVIKELPDLTADVIDASADGEENYYFGFSTGSSVSYYGKASSDDGDLKLIHTFSVENSYQVQGDFENTPILVSFCRGGKSYVVFPTYREAFFDFVTLDDGAGSEDMVMHQGNYLDIRLYILDNEKATLVQTTSIPVIKDDDDDVLATYYQVGGFRWADDVSFDTFTNDGLASFYVTRSNYLRSTDGISDYCFYVYDPDGNKIKTIFEYADQYFGLSDVEGCNPQYLFTSYTTEGYYYNMVDIVTGDKKSIYSYIDTGYDEPELISANVDRVDMGDGSYKYAFEMRVPLLDEDDNTVMRVAWLNEDGSLYKIDNINMGKNIDYAQCYISGEALHPDFFNEDDVQEYMVLVKYITAAGNEEHLLVAQACTDENPNGKELLRLTPCEKGTLSMVSLTPLNGEMMLYVLYSNDSAYTADFYNLPLESNELGGISAPVSEGIYFDGTDVVAPGLDISVYNVSGIKVAGAYNICNTSDLSAGIYMVVTKKGTRKILVK